MHELPHCRKEAISAKLTGSHFCKLSAQAGDLALELHTLHLVPVAQLHEKLICDLAGRVVLIDLLIQLQNGLVSGDGLLQFVIQLFLFRQHVLLRFLRQQLSKAFLIRSQAFPDLPQLQLHDFLHSIRPDIMPGLAGATIVFLVIGAAEEMDVLVACIGSVPQLLAAVSAVEKIGKDILLSVFRLGSPASGISNQLLHLLK